MTLAVRYLFISLLLLTGCVSNENQYQGYIFGTYYNIKISDSPNLNTIQSSIDLKLREIDMLFSNYKSESYLMRFNRKENQATNDDFTNLLNHSIEICKFVCDSSDNDHLEIDFSAIAKGYAVDEIARLLDDQNLNNYFIDIGGEILVKGNKIKSPWIICIENPDTQNSKPIECLSKKDNEKYMAVATSGDYRNFFTLDNKRYSHTIDPKTGFPISNNLTSVSVALPGQFRHAGDADALATSLNVMGLKEGFEFAVNNSIAALFIFRSEGEFSISMSPSFEDIIH